LLRELSYTPIGLITLVALFLTVAGVAVPLIARARVAKWRSDTKWAEKFVRDVRQQPQPSSSQIATQQVHLRLTEANTAREQQKSAAQVLKWSSNSLAFGQYVIGGVLASSFVQQSLNTNLVGLLGVLVLIASLVKQQYHPELKADEASRKASRLQILIRISDDQLTALEAKSTSGEDRTDALIDLMNRITLGLNEIEDPEATQVKSKPKDPK
jgi:hypothetical protein